MNSFFTVKPIFLTQAQPRRGPGGYLDPLEGAKIDFLYQMYTSGINLESSSLSRRCRIKWSNCADICWYIDNRYRVIFMGDQIPIRPERSLQLGRQTSK